MRKAIFVCLASLFALAQSFAQAVSTFDVSIGFYNKRLYYLSDEAVPIRVTITNTSAAQASFLLADDRVFSLDFDARTLTNTALPAADTLNRKRATSGQVYFRRVSLDVGESFSFVENLLNYCAITDAGNYVIQARFYPSLYKNAGNGTEAESQPLLSNRLNLKMRPPLFVDGTGVPVQLDKATGAVLTREPLPPDQVVSYMLRARQKSQWEKFFLYLNLEKLLSRDAVMARRWQNTSAQEHGKMLADYRARLEASKEDSTISVIPSSFEIQRTTYDSRTGQVVALEKFDQDGYTAVKRYTYYLEKQEAVWTIVDYMVVNMGTE
jgi:hypothetical protein